MIRTAIRTFCRSELEAHIDDMIAILDTLDGDPDFEPENDNEPSLGWPAYGPGALAPVFEHDDREVEDENDEDGGDTEPDGDEADHSFSEDEFTGR